MSLRIAAILSLVAGALTARMTDADASPLAFECSRIDIAIERDSTQGPLGEAHGCPGPLSAQALSNIDGNSYASVSASLGQVTHEHLYLTDTGSAPRYFRSVATVEFSLDSAASLLRLLPTLEYEGGGNAAWNVRIGVFNEDTGDATWFFAGVPIYPTDAAFMSDPPVQEAVLSLIPGDSYTFRSIVQLFANTNVEQSNTVSIALFAVPESEPLALIALGLAALSARRVSPAR